MSIHDVLLTGHDGTPKRYADAYDALALAQHRAYGASSRSELLRDAISNANQALSIDPNSSIAVHALAHIQHSTGRPIEALLMARRTLETHPEDLDAIAATADAYFRTGLYERAIPLYEKALAGEPASAEFRSQLVRLHLFLGQHEKGIAILSSVPPSEAGPFGMLLYAASGHMAKAVEIARGTTVGPPNGFTAYVRGFVLASAGDYAGARTIWTNAVSRRAAVRVINRKPDIGGIDAMIYAKLGRKAEALQTMEQAMATDPEHPVGLFFAAQTRALLGLRREALETLKAAVKNGFFNLPIIDYHTRSGLSFHILRNDPEFHAIRADITRRIDDLRARY